MHDVMHNASSHNAYFDQFHNGIIPGDIVMFHIQNEVKDALSRWQLGGLA